MTCRGSKPTTSPNKHEATDRFPDRHKSGRVALSLLAGVIMIAAPASAQEPPHIESGR